MINIRFFGSSGCVNCLEVSELLRESGLQFEYVDALNPSDKIQKFCDVHNVDDLPHIQFIQDEGILFQHVGEVNESLRNLITYCRTINGL